MVQQNEMVYRKSIGYQGNGRSTERTCTFKIHARKNQQEQSRIFQGNRAIKKGSKNSLFCYLLPDELPDEPLDELPLELLLTLPPLDDPSL